MTPFTIVDDKLIKTEHLFFVDKGITVKNGTTRTYAVHSGYDHSMLGYIKWFAQWRQYVLFPLNGVFNRDCLREAADFCETVTMAHREKRKAFVRS